MTLWKRLASYGGIRPGFWGAALGVGIALGPLLAAGPPPAAPPTSLDFAGLYRVGPAPLAPVLRREGDSLRLLLNHAAPAAGSAAAPLVLRLTAWGSYDAPQPLWQQAQPLRPYPGSDPTAPVQVLTAAVAASRLAPGQVLQVSLAPAGAAAPEAAAGAPAGAKQDPATTAWLPLTAEQLRRSFILLDSTGLVLDKPYLREGSAVAVAEYDPAQPVRWRRYPAGAAALPPFADPRNQPATPRRLVVLDSSAAPVVAGQLIKLPRPGLVAFRVGGGLGAPVRTVPLLVVRPDFPGQTTATELIDNLLYLTSAAERQQLAAAPDPKRAVDRFWLQAAGGDQARARDLIRRYYGHVTAANELFSGHKPGWRTDRGLLYVVLGPPQRVTRTATDEQWHYERAGRQGQPATFTFRPRPSTLAPDNYELVRRPEYELLWYAAVEQWRRPLSAR